MSPHELCGTLVTHHRARAKQDTLYYRLLAQADATGACLEHGAADAGGYVAKQTRKTSFGMQVDDQGVAHGRFKIPAAQAAMLRKAIQAFTNPGRHDTTRGSAIDPDLPQSVREGIAFGQLAEAIEGRWIPTTGGVGATVVVTMTLQQLIAELEQAGVCTLDDVGQKRRFHTEPMRIALGSRDKGCTAEDCEFPASMCHAHHDILYSKGGATSVENGRLLCGHHHRRIHDPEFRHETLPTGKVRFHLRC